MAVLLDEAAADTCVAVLEAEDELLIPAVTVAEALIVAARRGLGAEMDPLLAGLGLEVVAVTGASAGRVAQAHDRWGKGVHQAGFNFGGCFAHEVVRDRNCHLLLVGRRVLRLHGPAGLVVDDDRVATAGGLMQLAERVRHGAGDSLVFPGPTDDVMVLVG